MVPFFVHQNNNFGVINVNQGANVRLCDGTKRIKYTTKRTLQYGSVMVQGLLKALHQGDGQHAAMVMVPGVLRVPPNGQCTA